MATITRLLFLALPLAVLASCGKDDTDGRQPGGEPYGERIKFEIGFAPVTRVATGTDFKSKWEEGDQIGIFAIPDDPSSYISRTGNTIHNAKLTYSSGSWTGDIYWPTDIEMGVAGLSFFAYYPYDDNGGNPKDLDAYTIPMGVSTDQRGQREHNRSDAMYAPEYSISRDDKGEPVYLQFRHLHAMMELTLDNGDRVIDPSGELNVTLKHIYAGGILDISQRRIIPDDAAGRVDILMHRVEKSGTTEYNDTYTFRAFVPVQDLASNERIFVIDNQDVEFQSSRLANNITLKAQQAEQFTQKLPPSVIKPQAEANSYMAVPYGRAILIPVSQANRVLDGESLGASTNGLNRVGKDNFTVELVWGDSPIETGGVVEAVEAVEIDNEGYIRVVPGRAGNAVIGIKLDDEQNYRWSWHIWVTEPVTYGTDTETGLTWMDRNLGAAGTGSYQSGGRNGLFYQWGRKDAFPASNGINNIQDYYTHAGGPTNNNSTGTDRELPGLVQFPLRFTTSTTYRGSLNVNTDNNSWGGVSGNKTVYDPCPSGWKVPPTEVNGTPSWGDYMSGSTHVWEAWINSGRIFNGVNGSSALGHYYPATGNRDYMSAEPVSIGNHAHYWTANSQSNNNGYFMLFRNSTVNTSSYTLRRYGFPIRCVAYDI